MKQLWYLQLGSLQAPLFGGYELAGSEKLHRLPPGRLSALDKAPISVLRIIPLIDQSFDSRIGLLGNFLLRNRLHARRDTSSPCAVQRF